MNCSKKKQNNGFKALIISWAVLFVVGAVIGGVIVNFIKQTPKPATVEAISTNEPKPLYGTRDGRVFTNNGEMSRDWGGELDFKPLDVKLDESTQEFIFYLSYGYYIDFPFVMGLIQQESSFNAKEISATNDYGLMQINKQNHDWLKKAIGVTDFLEPEQNVLAGLYILRGLFEKYDDPSKVLMAYNMGEYGASLLWEQGIYETNYTRKVLTYAENFKEELENNE